MPAKTVKTVPVYVAGNSTIHAGRKIGNYASGEPKFVKICGQARTDRHDASPVGGNAEVTCKRCLAKLPKTAETNGRKGATGPRYTPAQIKLGLAAKRAGKTNREVAEAAGVKSPAYFSKTLKAEIARRAKPRRTVRRSTRAAKVAATKVSVARRSTKAGA